jgi:hypothetical protein
MSVLLTSGWGESKVRQTADVVSRIPTLFRAVGEWCVARMILPQLLKKQELCLGCKRIGESADAFGTRACDFPNPASPLTVSR